MARAAPLAAAATGSGAAASLLRAELARSWGAARARIRGRHCKSAAHLHWQAPLPVPVAAAHPSARRQFRPPSQHLSSERPSPEDSLAGSHETITKRAQHNYTVCKAAPRQPRRVSAPLHLPERHGRGAWQQASTTKPPRSGQGSCPLRSLFEVSGCPVSLARSCWRVSVRRRRLRAERPRRSALC